MSSVPITYPINGTFKIESIFSNINSISGIIIDSNTGIIYVNNNVPIEEYTLNISYNYKLIYSYFTYIIEILPNLRIINLSDLNLG